jgi:hypothetical protein
LGALDTAWMIKTFFERGGAQEHDQPLLDEWIAEFKVMVLDQAALPRTKAKVLT